MKAKTRDGRRRTFLVDATFTTEEDSRDAVAIHAVEAGILDLFIPPGDSVDPGVRQASPEPLDLTKPRQKSIKTEETRGPAVKTEKIEDEDMLSYMPGSAFKTPVTGQKIRDPVLPAIKLEDVDGRSPIPKLERLSSKKTGRRKREGEFKCTPVPSEY